MARQPQVQYIHFYNPGSEAYQYDFPPVRKNTSVTLPKPKRRKRTVLRIDLFAVAGLCVAMVLFVSMVCGAVRLGITRSEQAEMAAYVERLQQENEVLQQTYAESYDIDEIYELAIAMGMIPAEQAQHISVPLVEEAQLQKSSAWQDFWIFLSGLFA